MPARSQRLDTVPDSDHGSAWPQACCRARPLAAGGAASVQMLREALPGRAPPCSPSTRASCGQQGPAGAAVRRQQLFPEKRGALRPGEGRPDTAHPATLGPSSARPDGRDAPGSAVPPLLSSRAPRT